VFTDPLQEPAINNTVTESVKEQELERNAPAIAQLGRDEVGSLAEV